MFKSRVSHLAAEQQNKYQTYVGALAVEVLVRFTTNGKNAGRPFDASVPKFSPPEIPGVRWRTAEEAERSDNTKLYADNAVAAYEWLSRNANRV